MNRLLKLLLVLVISVGALGYYQGWFNMTVDKEKIKADEERARDRIEAVGERVKEKAAGTVDRIKKETGRAPAGDREKP
jgi:hypothetical protein